MRLVRGSISMSFEIFGDGANIASRIEPLAQPGQLLISETIHRNVLNKTGIKTQLIGEKQLKNVREARKIYLVLININIIAQTLTER